MKINKYPCAAAAVITQTRPTFRGGVAGEDCDDRKTTSIETREGLSARYYFYYYYRHITAVPRETDVFVFVQIVVLERARTAVRIYLAAVLALKRVGFVGNIRH